MTYHDPRDAHVTKMEKIHADIQEALYEGGYRPSSAHKYAWMCNDCRLVWPMKHQARDCAERKHVTQYAQEYPGGYDQNTGKPLPPILYPRHAIRKEPLPMPARSYSVQHKGYLFRVVANPEQEATRDFSARGAHDDWLINATARVSKARIAGQTVWQLTANGLPHNVYVTHEQAEALDLPKP